MQHVIVFICCYEEEEEDGGGDDEGSGAGVVVCGSVRARARPCVPTEVFLCTLCCYELSRSVLFLLVSFCRCGFGAGPAFDSRGVVM